MCRSRCSRPAPQQPSCSCAHNPEQVSWPETCSLLARRAGSGGMSSGQVQTPHSKIPPIARTITYAPAENLGLFAPIQIPDGLTEHIQKFVYVGLKQDVRQSSKHGLGKARARPQSSSQATWPN